MTQSQTETALVQEGVDQKNFTDPMVARILARFPPEEQNEVRSGKITLQQLVKREMDSYQKLYRHLKHLRFRHKCKCR
jgi:hypothetical protein